MKKNFVSSLLVTMVCVSTMIGCGNSSIESVEDIQIEAQLYDVIEETLEEINDEAVNEVHAEADEVRDTENAEVFEDDAVSVDTDHTLQDIAEKEHLDIDVVRRIEKEFNPTIIAAEEKWTEILNISREWKDLVYEMNQVISAKAVVKLIDINLNDSTATYKVTSPDVIGFLAENMKQATSARELADVLKESLERDEFTVKEREITIPIYISGSEVSLDVNDSEIMDTITGGFYGVFETVK